MRMLSNPFFNFELWVIVVFLSALSSSLFLMV